MNLNIDILKAILNLTSTKNKIRWSSISHEIYIICWKSITRLDMLQISLDGFDKIRRSSFQKKVHDEFIDSCIHLIYEKPWDIINDDIMQKKYIMKEKNVNHNNQLKFLNISRRAGSTYSIAMFCAVLVWYIPDIQIAVICSSGEKKLMALIIHCLKEITSPKLSERRISGHYEYGKREIHICAENKIYKEEGKIRFFRSFKDIVEDCVYFNIFFIDDINYFILNNEFINWIKDFELCMVEFCIPVIGIGSLSEPQKDIRYSGVISNIYPGVPIIDIPRKYDRIGWPRGKMISHYGKKVKNLKKNEENIQID